MKSFYKDLPLLDKILNSSYRIMLTLLAMCSVYSLNLVLATNSAYSDSEVSEGNSFTAGYWIPVLTYSVPAVNGENGWYVAPRPCIILTAKIGNSTDGSTINYIFKTDGGTVIDSGSIDSGACVLIPDGDLNFNAVAVNDENSDWKSSPLNKHFKVDTVAPEIPEWDSPADNSYTHQENDVKIKWHSTDATSGVAGYKYISDYPGGQWKSYDYCHGLLADDHIPSSQVGPGGSCLNDHEATLGKDGNYKRKVLAVDEAGNESDWSAVWEMNRDTVKPSSQIDSVTQDLDDPYKIYIDFSATDDRSGVKQVEIFWQKDGGSWTSLGEFEESESPITFTADAAGEYGFYSVAEDKADDLGSSDMADGSSGDNGHGNKEDKTPLVEASVVVEDGGEEGEPPCEGEDCEPPVPGFAPMAVKTKSKKVEKDTNLEQATDTVEKAASDDQTAPASRIKKIKERSGKKNAQKFKFTLSARDAGSGVDKTVVYYRKGNEDWKKLGETDTDVFKSDKLDRGVYEFYTLAEDKAGNQEQKDNPKPEARVTITKDKTTVEILTDGKKAKKAKHKSKKKSKKSQVKKSEADKKKTASDKKNGKKKKKQ